MNTGADVVDLPHSSETDNPESNFEIINVVVVVMVVIVIYLLHTEVQKNLGVQSYESVKYLYQISMKMILKTIIL